jgi:uncharacterized membrane protein
MTRQQVIWAIVAAIQLAVLVGVALRLRNTPRARHWAAGVVLIAVGTVIVAADVAWIATGGAEGRSRIGMRGGWFGFWLSLLTAAECLAIGLLLVVVWRRQEHATRKGSSVASPFSTSE